MGQVSRSGPLTLSKRIENMFSFLEAAKEEDLCYFDPEFVAEVKAAALKGAAASENRTQLSEGDKDLAALLRALAEVELPTWLCETIGTVNLRLRQRYLAAKAGEPEIPEAPK